MNFFAITDLREKNCRVSVPVRSNSLGRARSYTLYRNGNSANFFQLAVFWCFAGGQHVDGCVSFMRCNIYNRLVNACVANTCNWIFMSMFFVGKCVPVFGFLRFFSSYIFSCDANDHSTQRAERLA